MHVVRPADAHLEHPSAPHGHVVRGADVVHALRRSEPADPPGLDVHDPRCADRDRLARVLAGVDRLVETDGRLDLALERRVVDEIVVRERLLDHHRARRIDALEKRSVAERVGRVRVEHEGKIGEGPPRRLRDLNLEARLDLELDTLVPALELAADSVHERFDRWLYANATPHRIRSRVPPSSTESGFPARFAKRSQTAISTVAFAMRCSRIHASFSST